MSNLMRKCHLATESANWRCRFSWLLPVIRLLTWAGSWFLNELSAGFSHRFVLFFGGRVGCYRADELTARRPRVSHSPIQRIRERLAATS